mgnify:CR=1 FL=1
MQIVIPMSGFGERFYKAGYRIPKALIEIDGKPIIAHVIDMFPGETDFLFICNQDHLNNSDYQMEAILRQYCPSGRVIGIPPHKLGPNHAVLQVNHLIAPNRPVLINYCDFTCYWDWQDFKKFINDTQCDGAIPAYKGFHPHTLGHTNYAYMREEDGRVLDIQEKQPYTDNRMEEYASSGTYYFSSGALMSKALSLTKEQGLTVGGEYYVSLAYKPLLALNCVIAVYPLQHFMQWGTPADVAEYNNWSAIFKRLLITNEPAITANGAVIIPMAGLGQRFIQEGYSITKPLIPVSGKPMVIQATRDLPAAANYVFVIRQEMADAQHIATELKASYPGAIIHFIHGMTDGQACTALIGLDALEDAIDQSISPVTFGACDSGALYDHKVLQALLDNPDIDVIVWGVRNHAHAIRNPHMYGWIDANDGLISRISVKKQLQDPTTDPIVLGTFTFRSPDAFRRVMEKLMARDGRVNGEFYLDSVINDAIELGLHCHLFEVDHLLSWGTPNDLRTFEYWQSCFHKWSSHPYRLELDKRIPKHVLSELDVRYKRTVPARPRWCYDHA